VTVHTYGDELAEFFVQEILLGWAATGPDMANDLAYMCEDPARNVPSGQLYWDPTP
jgi:hypothetical protein